MWSWHQVRNHAVLLVLLNFSSFATFRRIWSWFIYCGTGTVIVRCRGRQYKQCIDVYLYRLEDFPFMQCTRGCLLFVALFRLSFFFSFLIFLLFIVLLLRSSWTGCICPRDLFPVRRLRIHCTVSWSIYHDTEIIWMPISLAQFKC